MIKRFSARLLATALGLQELCSGVFAISTEVDTNTWQYGMLKATNTLRAEHKKEPVGINMYVPQDFDDLYALLITRCRKLQCTAQIHSEWMAKTKTVNHFGSEKNMSPKDRAKQQNFTNSISENIWSGFLGGAEMVLQFENSPAELNNILSDYNCVGFGRAFDDTDTPYWSQIFATSDDEECTPPEDIAEWTPPAASSPFSSSRKEEDKSQCILTQTSVNSSTPSSTQAFSLTSAKVFYEEIYEGKSERKEEYVKFARSLVAKSDTSNSADVDTSTWQYEMLMAVNELRAKNGSEAMGMSLKLQCAAQLFANWMASVERMGHFGPEENKGPGERVAEQEFVVGAVAENAGADLKSASEMVWGWSLSEGHNVNMLRANLNCAGFGRAFGKDMKPYWCQVFATSEGEHCPPPETITAVASPHGTTPGLAPDAVLATAPIENTEQCVKPPSSGAEQSKNPPPPPPPSSREQNEKSPPSPPPSESKEGATNPDEVTFDKIKKGEGSTNGLPSGKLKGNEETSAPPAGNAEPKPEPQPEPEKEGRDDESNEKSADGGTPKESSGHCY
uniref:AlNc14C278G10073 protein n=1 Tax=Albugo laibachii Nc14 TaxID=890382 RepID=F0WUS3_9STRA|nr:AlNc14C278G10073 [Albugo laibachii Nc14]|eukprot:CCA25159.1 AlNc14C278G10073 [Albugo laibachii Nc14]